MPKIIINDKLEEITTAKQPLIAVIGGRGSGKSIGISDILCMKMETEKADILCLREHQNLISESVHKTLEQSINSRLDLSKEQIAEWQILETKITSPSGAKTAYFGAVKNPSSLQSASMYKYSWFEEAQRASQESIDKLIPTIIRIPGAKCIFTANPQNSGDPFSKRFINPFLSDLEKYGRYEDDIHLIIVLNWRDNPWWNVELEAIRKWDFENQPRSKYDWIWEGKFNDSVDDAIIKPEWFDSAIDAHIKLGFEGEGPIVAGHDPSDTGPDAKGFALRHGSILLDVQDRNYGDVNEGCDWALDLALKANADCFSWDCDGLGVSLKRQVSQALYGKKTEFYMFKGSETPNNPDDIYQGEDEPDYKREKTNRQAIKNKRAQYYVKLRDRFRNTYLAVEKKQYIDPDQMISISSKISVLNRFRTEICRIPLKPNGHGSIQIMSKIEMLKLRIPSPNLADAVMYTMIEPEFWSHPEDSEYDYDYDENIGISDSGY